MVQQKDGRRKVDVGVTLAWGGGGVAVGPKNRHSPRTSPELSTVHPNLVTRHPICWFLCLCRLSSIGAADKLTPGANY